MKHFAIKTLSFLLVFFIFDKIFYFFVLLSPSLEADVRLEKVIKGDISSDLIVIGSSRGARNIIAKQIEDSLKSSAYNLSYPGSDIEFHEFLLRSFLKYNEKPRTVLLVIDDPGQLLPDESINFRLDRLYPLVRYKHINNELITRGEKTWFSKAFVLARINKRNFDIRIKNFTSLDSISACGSMPIYSKRDNYSFEFDNSTQHYNKENEIDYKLEAFLRFQDQCAKNDIELLLVFPPNFKFHNIEIEHRMRELSSQGIRMYIYDTSNPIYYDKSYYFDESHLIRKGAVVFTNELIGVLKAEAF